MKRNKGFQAPIFNQKVLNKSNLRQKYLFFEIIIKDFNEKWLLMKRNKGFQAPIFDQKVLNKSNLRQKYLFFEIIIKDFSAMAICCGMF